LARIATFARRHVNLLLVLAVIPLTVPLFALGEKIDRKGGLGWDGSIYGRMVRDGLGALQWVDSYYVQRILPPLAIRLSLDLVRLEVTTRTSSRSSVVSTSSA